VIEHRVNAPGIIHWASLRKRGTIQQIHEVRFGNSSGMLVSDIHILQLHFQREPMLFTIPFVEKSTLT